MSFIKPIYTIQDTIVSDTDTVHEGFVEDNNDPLMLRRVRVRIPLYEDLDIEDIPFASPQDSDLSGGLEDCGNFYVPELGSKLTVHFPTRDLNHPYYLGSVVDSKTVNTVFAEDYPNCYGHSDKLGNYFKVNKATGETEYTHFSGTSFKIDVLGNVSIDSVGSISYTAQNSINLTAPAINLTGTVNPSGGISGTIATTSGSATFVSGILVNIA